VSLAPPSPHFPALFLLLVHHLFVHHPLVSHALSGWFDALARQQVHDAVTFSRVLLQPLADDVRRWTWLHERYFCDGTQQSNRTWA
jgi:hypothetical protein